VHKAGMGQLPELVTGVSEHVAFEAWHELPHHSQPEVAVHVSHVFSVHWGGLRGQPRAALQQMAVHPGIVAVPHGAVAPEDKHPQKVSPAAHCESTS
jgi:hypothetical protein